MSDIKAAEAIASTGGPPETSPANAPAAQETPAETLASSEGGSTPAPAAADRAAPGGPDKMENQLEMSKENKTKAETPADVAGQKQKNGFLQKLMPWKKDKK